jgi:hypothetical protein
MAGSSFLKKRKVGWLAWLQDFGRFHHGLSYTFLLTGVEELATMLMPEKLPE